MDETINFVMMGHVDHGKSTTSGRILVDTGNVSESEINNAKKEAEINNMKTWWLAYLLDEFSEERIVGKTFEYINKIVYYKDRALNMIDVPGHNNYITEMIEGTSQADIAVLVCSAKKGELEKGLKGQTYEHLILAKSMGINTLIVAINKIDTLEEPWENKYHEIKDKIAKLIKQLKYKNVHFVPISGYIGTNVVHSIDNYTSLMDTLINIEYEKKIVNRVKSNIFKAQCIFINVPTLITIGFSGKLHSGELVTDFTIVDINSRNNKKFVVSSDKGYITLELELPKIETLEQYLILRSYDQTIAIGKIIF